MRAGTQDAFVGLGLGRVMGALRNSLRTTTNPGYTVQSWLTALPISPTMRRAGARLRD